jgi:glucosamine-6-phosphate deaminase
VIEGPISDRTVALGLATILEAREVVILVSDASKREALRRVVDGPVTEQVPASILQRQPRCMIPADGDASP